MKAFRKFIRILFCHLLFRVEYIGSKEIDFSKTYLVASNHVSWADPFFIWSEVPDLSIMAKEELFKFKPFAWFLNKFGIFPIARGKKDFGHVLQAVKVIKGKRNLLIFPEGTRKAKQKGISAKNGAVFVAVESKVEILPIHLSEKIRLFGKVKVEFRKPVKIEIPKEDIKNKEVLSNNTERVMEIIYKGEVSDWWRKIR